jgi:hypothetical protein
MTEERRKKETRMKMRSMTKKNWFAGLTLSAFLLNGACAYAGTDTGGGGDPWESRFSEIRTDLLKWIGEGGADDLAMPEHITREAYVEEMRFYLARHAIKVSFITTKQESLTQDDNRRVYVEGLAKTCRSFIDQKRILCNSERFGAAPEGLQYRVVHHEFALFAGAEVNEGASSDYFISDQLAGFLAPTTLRLTRNLKPVPRCVPKVRPETALSNCRVHAGRKYRVSLWSYERSVPPVTVGWIAGAGPLPPLPATLSSDSRVVEVTVPSEQNIYLLSLSLDRDVGAGNGCVDVTVETEDRAGGGMYTIGLRRMCQDSVLSSRYEFIVRR